MPLEIGSSPPPQESVTSVAREAKQPYAMKVAELDNIQYLPLKNGWL
jgi:hypothetical protein